MMTKCKGCKEMIYDVVGHAEVKTVTKYHLENTVLYITIANEIYCSKCKPLPKK